MATAPRLLLPSARTDLVRVEKVEVDGNPVWVLHMGATPNGAGGFQNKFSDDLIASLHTALDRVEKERDGGAGAVVTIADGGKASKHYSDGLDLEYLMGSLAGTEAKMEFLQRVELLFKRLLFFPLPTVAALNGHAFAGGFLLALTHDHRVMNNEKGFACMSEIDIGSPLTGGFSALINEKVSNPLRARMMLEGGRHNAAELLRERVLTGVAPADKVLEEALQLAGKLAPKGASPAVEALKKDLYPVSAAALGKGTMQGKSAML